jgi:surfeit locus 1 family protein
LLADDPWQDGWPKRVQRMDIRPMATSLGVARPVEVRLDFAPAGLAEAASQGHDFRASRHQGYAAQWFGLALVLGVGYIIYGFKRNA